MKDTEVRGIWENVKIVIQQLTNTIGYSAEATSNIARTANSLAETGLVMADANKEIVSLETTLERELKLRQIKEKFGLPE